MVCFVLYTILLTVGRLELFNARIQGNLKEDILKPKMKILESTKEKNRGPYLFGILDPSGNQIGAVVNSKFLLIL